MSDGADPDFWLENSAGERFVIAGSCTLGRAHTNNIVLADPRASRRHAVLRPLEGDQYWIVDLGSRHGTRLNGRRITEPALVLDGDSLEIGSTTFTFHRASGPGPRPGGQANPETIADCLVAEDCWLLLAEFDDAPMADPKLRTIEDLWDECAARVVNCDGKIHPLVGDGLFAYWLAGPGMELQVAKVIAALKELQAGPRPPFRLVLHHGAVFREPAENDLEALSGSEVEFAFLMVPLGGELKEPCVASEAAAAQLEGHLAFTAVGRHPVPDWEGEFGFARF